MKLPLILASLLLAASSASATVTLQFTTATGSLQNFENRSSVGGAAMVWGIMIDTAGNGFSYNEPTYFLNPIGLTYTGGLLQNLNFWVNGIVTVPSDDVLFLSSNLMNVQASEADGMPAGTNRVTSLAGVPIGTNGINTGDAFAVVWWSNAAPLTGTPISITTWWGAVNNPGFVIPADGNTTSFADLFTGPDALKTPNHAFPEPSAALLGLLGVATLLRRRR